MKKHLTLLTVLCTLFMSLTANCAWAETIDVYGVLTPISNAAQLDMDGDGTLDSIEYTITTDEEGYDTGYTLRINDTAVTAYGCSMNRQLYALRLEDSGDSIFLMVSDYGPSDDPETTFYYFKDGMIRSAGTIYAMPEEMEISEKGVITATVRGSVLYTWFHEANFAFGVGYDEEWNASYYIYQIPHYVYPMGILVTLKVDLPLVISMTDSEVSATLPAGSQAIICASDDVGWIYIQAIDSLECGWVKVTGDSKCDCIVGNEILSSYDVFDGLIFAD